jgi:hydrogenase nickel incorporation protein HypA/HybF
MVIFNVHEFSLMESIAATAIKAARDNGISDIKCIRLRVGTLSGVSVDALQFAFDAFRINGDLHCDALDIEYVYASGVCNVCATEFEVKAYWQVCPKCGSIDACYDGGMDFFISEIEGD